MTNPSASSWTYCFMVFASLNAYTMADGGLILKGVVFLTRDYPNQCYI